MRHSHNDAPHTMLISASTSHSPHTHSLRHTWPPPHTNKSSLCPSAPSLLTHSSSPQSKPSNYDMASSTVSPHQDHERQSSLTLYVYVFWSVVEQKYPSIFGPKFFQTFCFICLVYTELGKRQLRQEESENGGDVGLLSGCGVKRPDLPHTHMHQTLLRLYTARKQMYNIVKSTKN